MKKGRTSEYSLVQLTHIHTLTTTDSIDDVPIKKKIQNQRFSHVEPVLAIVVENRKRSFPFVDFGLTMLTGHG